MQIINFKDLGPSSPTVATFDIYFHAWEMTFHKVKLVKTKKGRMFVALPTWCELLEDGTKKFHPYILFSEKKTDGFQKSVLDLLSEFISIDQ